jgi:hypothetical protein
MRAVVAAIATLFIGVFAGSGVALAEPTATVPSADQLTAQLKRVLNTSLSDSDRAAELEGGLAAVPTANNIAGAMDRYSGMMSWKVQNPALDGDRLDAQLAVSVPVFGTRTHDIYWVDQDGKWKLSNPSACLIARDAAGTDCTV